METKESYYKQYFSDNKKNPETSMADHKEDNKHKKTNWMNLFPVS